MACCWPRLQPHPLAATVDNECAGPGLCPFGRLLLFAGRLQQLINRSAAKRSVDKDDMFVVGSVVLDKQLIVERRGASAELTPASTLIATPGVTYACWSPSADVAAGKTLEECSDRCSTEFCYEACVDLYGGTNGDDSNGLLELRVARQDSLAEFVRVCSLSPTHRTASSTRCE